MNNKWLWLAAGVALGVFVAPHVMGRLKSAGGAA